MDELGRYINSMMGWVMLMTAHDMVKNFVEKVIEAETKLLTMTLGHEPTDENRQYYRDLQWQKSNPERAQQREADREKLRRLVFGEEQV
jgi:hypothetical protein